MEFNFYNAKVIQPEMWQSNICYIGYVFFQFSNEIKSCKYLFRTFKNIFKKQRKKYLVLSENITSSKLCFNENFSFERIEKNKIKMRKNIINEQATNFGLKRYKDSRNTNCNVHALVDGKNPNNSQLIFINPLCRFFSIYCSKFFTFCNYKYHPAG